ncbi:MAG: peptidylprolyl isomerase [Actinomycetota bacterium]|nr:peptidylprolyl isomerase [Actinomycetota bacterium]
MRRPPRLLFARHSHRLVVLLVVAVVASACGSSVVAVRVGDSTLDRDGVAALVAEVTGRSSDATIDATTTAGVVDRFVQYEALVDLLAYHDVVATPEERSTARDRLLAAGMDPGDPSLPRLIGWQAALDLVEAGGPGVGAAYEAHVGFLSYELCTSHILVSAEDDAHAVIHLLDTGGDFAALAVSVSQDPGSGQSGGSLGCVPLGAFVPTFERAVLGALAEGLSLVGPVPSQFGFHVIRIDEVRTVDPVPFEALGQRASAALLQVAGLSREVQVDARYGIWDRAIGRVAPPAGPLAPALARLGS